MPPRHPPRRAERGRGCAGALSPRPHPHPKACISHGRGSPEEGGKHTAGEMRVWGMGSHSLGLELSWTVTGHWRISIWLVPGCDFNEQGQCPPDSARGRPHTYLGPLGLWSLLRWHFTQVSYCPDEGRGFTEVEPLTQGHTVSMCDKTEASRPQDCAPPCRIDGHL